MYAFIRPSRIRNAALTEVPMIPPTVLKLSKRSETAAAVAATTIDVMITILGWVSFGLILNEVTVLTLSGQARRTCPR